MAQVLILLLLALCLDANETFKVKSFKELKYKNVVQQSFEESCGASSLATLINMYDINVTERDLIDDLNTTNMVNFLDLSTIAQKNGFNAKGYNITREVFEQLRVPVIARVLRHKEYPHFIVVQNLKGDFILSLDPNNGKRIITKSEFYSVWNSDDNGHILVVLPKVKKELKIVEYLDTSSLLVK